MIDKLQRQSLHKCESFAGIIGRLTQLLSEATEGRPHKLQCRFSTLLFYFNIIIGIRLTNLYYHE